MSPRTLLTSSRVIHTTSQPDAPEQRRRRDAATAAAALHRWCGVEFAVLDGESGEMLSALHDPEGVDWHARAELVRQVSRGGKPAFLEEEDPVVALAVPLALGGQNYVAVALFLTREARGAADLARAAVVFGLAAEMLWTWARRQKPASPDMLERLAHLAASRLEADARIVELENEHEQLSARISATFEEISLIYQLTHHLKISSSKQDLGRAALALLAEVVPAEGLAIRLEPSDDEEVVLLEHGVCPLDSAGFASLVEDVAPGAATVVLNRSVTDDPLWQFDGVRQLILVPLADGDRVFGWLAAFNHPQDQEFGTTEASLLNSVASLLAIHGSNIDLYRQQSDVLAGVVRAMSSAIDAKDPYTRGHSDRVARVAVRLAQELGCDADTVNTIYLAGLLHDVGKIGVDDQVLRKPGKLTDAEFEHVKTHVEIGYRILREVKKMSHVLPVVLHHHEAWDGSGYPHGMAGEAIPYLARIVAVADAYDAMASDRPYRAGMPEEKLDAIIRSGAGRQWDPAVVAAFFRARDEIRDISRREVNHNDLATLQWN